MRVLAIRRGVIIELRGQIGPRQRDVGGERRAELPALQQPFGSAQLVERASKVARRRGHRGTVAPHLDDVRRRTQAPVDGERVTQPCPRREVGAASQFHQPDIVKDERGVGVAS